jgi:Spy/CpxP family protein refolding chaperone
MKTPQVIRLITIVLICAATAAFAQPTTGQGGARRGAGAGGQAGGRGAAGGMMRMNVSENLRDAMRELREVREQFREEMQKVRQELSKAMFADKLDDAAIITKTMDVAKVEAKQNVAMAKAFKEISKKLSPEELELAKRMTGVAGGRGMMMGRGGMGAGPRGEAGAARPRGDRPERGTTGEGQRRPRTRQLR